VAAWNVPGREHAGFTLFRTRLESQIQSPPDFQLDTGLKRSQIFITMKTATIRDLRYDFPKLEAWLAGGEEILITKHSKPVARLCAPSKAGKKHMPPLPDFRARLRKTWGDRFFTRQEVEEMRAFETGEP
jgi:antitoxin (DNA-binding transcriptional repressor) of toxin-antitoxin stability system